MEDTIAAVATAIGDGGISIIRISGEKSLDILESIFKSPKGRKIENRKLTYGYIEANGEIVDEVLVSYMKKPHTYTAEDVVEVNCHGGSIVTKKILQLILDKGARLAEAGEFTKRAFLNGRLDMSQAEAVIDIIKAKTDVAANVAIKQLSGGISKKITSLRNDLTDILVNLTVNIDYPDEDIEEVTYGNLLDDLNSVKEKIQLLLKTSSRGRILQEGYKVSIIGKPNVGKSSLLNNLLRENRAIVTDIPGTTRDTIEEFINIKGIPVKIIDTAGIRETDDEIEKIGIEKSISSFEQSDLIVIMLDSSRDLEEDDTKVLRDTRDCNAFVVLNKIDKERVLDRKKISEYVDDKSIIETSMNSLDDVLKIEEEIYRRAVSTSELKGDRDIITNARHEHALKNALKSIDDAINSAKINAPLEFIEIDVSNSYDELGFITGDSVREDIINQVFSRFCLGK